MADVVGVVLDGGQKALLFEIGDDAFAGHVAVEPGVGAAFGVDVGGIVHDVDGRQMVPLANGEVVGVVRRGDLHGAGAEVAADPLVEDDGNFAVHQRQAQLFAVQMQVALVLGMNGNGHIAEHGLRAGRRDGQKLAGVLPACVEDGVADLQRWPLCSS